MDNVQLRMSREVLQSPDASSQPALSLCLLWAEENECALTNPLPARLAWSPVFPKSLPLTPGPPSEGPIPGTPRSHPGLHPAVPSAAIWGVASVSGRKVPRSSANSDDSPDLVLVWCSSSYPWHSRDTHGLDPTPQPPALVPYGLLAMAPAGELSLPVSSGHLN